MIYPTMQQAKDTIALAVEDNGQAKQQVIWWYIFLTYPGMDAYNEPDDVYIEARSEEAKILFEVHKFITDPKRLDSITPLIVPDFLPEIPRTFEDLLKSREPAEADHGQADSEHKRHILESWGICELLTVETMIDEVESGF
jgi:hypothetical protein